MFKTILVAVDINHLEGAERLVDSASALGMAETRFHVASVLPEPGFALVGLALPADHEGDMMKAAQAQLDEWAAPKFERVQAHVLKGSIYDGVLKLAKQIGADAIVVGAHRPELRDYLVGPNAAKIVRHATQSVFVVRDA